MMPYKILMFVPAFGGQISATTFLTTHQLRENFLIKGIGSGISTMSFPNIGELRDMYLTIFADAIKDATHLLMIDADMGFPPDLVNDMLLFNEPLVGTCYAKRTLPLAWTPSGFANNQGTTQVRAGHMLVEGMGMGCTLIRRDCVEKMMEAYPQLIDTRIQLHPAWEMFKASGINRLLRFFDPLDIPERGILSEDLAFCVRWNQIGGQCWANINHRISHVGPYDFAGRYMDEIQRQVAVAAATTQQPAAAMAPADMLAAMQAIAKPNGPMTTEMSAPPPPQPVEVVQPAA